MTLTARGLAVTARIDGHPVEALRDLDFSVAPGRVLGLVGESGAGKSMIGRVIARTLPPGFTNSAGSLIFDGRDLLRIRRSELRMLLGDRICFIPQEPLSALNPLLTIEAQFGEHFSRLGVPAEDRRSRIIAALEEVRLPQPSAILTRYPFQLSGGQCQRVLIAMAFASDPALVIADEPTTALDVSTQAAIVQIMRRLQHDHATAMLFITHDLRLAARVCDDILVLYAGEIVEVGPAQTVIAAPRHPYTRALNEALPPLTGTPHRLVILPDQMPGLGGLQTMSGCRFAPRCPTRNHACAKSIPPLTEVAPGHAVRCIDACLSEPKRIGPLPAALPPAPAASRPVLHIEQLSKTFPGRRDWLGRRGPAVHAIRNIAITVHAGEFLGVVGESGSGKSTLGRVIMGLEKPTTGRIIVDGQDVTSSGKAARNVRLGALQMVFQDPQSALNPRRSVGQLVTQPMEARRTAYGFDAQHRRARQLLAETGLPPELLDRFPAQLSGGQKQRVNIARALCLTPRLLVADEIVSGLDVSVQAQILNLLIDLRRDQGIGMIFISHDLAVVRYLCTRIVVMQNGEIVEEADTATLFAAPRHPYTRMLLAATPPEDPNVPWPSDAMPTTDGPASPAVP